MALFGSVAAAIVSSSEINSRERTLLSPRLGKTSGHFSQETTTHPVSDSKETGYIFARGVP